MIHVVYAEDEHQVAEMVTAHLALPGSGIALEVVTNGRGCLDRMQKGGVDVLLLDMNLPDMDGLRILGELAVRGDPTPVVMVSAEAQTELAVKALRAGAVDCIEKTSPQFARIGELVKNIHARRAQESPISAAAPHDGVPYEVILLEQSEPARRALEVFFEANAPRITLHTMEAPSDLETFMAGGRKPDAVILGSVPAGQRVLDVLRNLRTDGPDLQTIVLASGGDSETAVAAFKLGAGDYILRKENYPTEVVFSLNHLLRHASLSRHNAQLAKDLVAINRSLEAQVALRTRKLHELSMRLIRVQEDERAAIARDLHDQLGQMLTGLGFLLESAAAKAEAPLKEQLAESVALSSRILKTVRELSLQLHPPILDDLSLRAAIEWHVRLFLERTGIAVHCEFSLPDERLPGALETTIFRVVQEALTNVARHSKATAAEVSVIADDDRIWVEVVDHGQGFDAGQAALHYDSLGLVGLSERVELSGGRFEIVSEPGRGTRVAAFFPKPGPRGTSPP